MTEIPADLPPEQHALFRALTTHADAVNKIIISRVEKVEDEQKLTRKDANVALAKANAALRSVGEVLKRVEAVENGNNRGQHSLPTRLTLEEAIRLEVKNVRLLVADAKSMSATVVIGYHKSTGIERMEKLQLATFVAQRTSADHCNIETRGRVGLIHFEQRENRTGETRARDFVRRIEEGEDSATVWARIERPEQLRWAEGLARSFEKAVQSSYPSDNQPRVRCMDGYLLVDNVVVAPVTMFQTAASFGKLRTVVNNVLCNSDRTPLDFNTPLFKQLRHSIVVTLHEFYDTVNFVFDNAPQVKPAVEEAFVDITDGDDEPATVQVSKSNHQPLLQPAKLHFQSSAVLSSTSNSKFVSSLKRGAPPAQGSLGRYNQHSKQYFANNQLKCDSFLLWRRNHKPWTGTLA